MGLFDFSSIKKSIASIGSEATKLRTELEKARREREELAAAPITREELTDALCDWIDRIGESYPRHLVSTVSHIRDHAEINPQSLTVPPALLTVHGGGSSPQVQPAALCFLLADVLKDGMRRAVEALPYPTAPGLPRAEKVEKLAALDKQIAKLEADLLELRNDAEAAGVSLRDLPPIPAKAKKPPTPV